MNLATKEAIEAALQPLVGEPLWACGRACDLASFQFGPRRTVKGWKGVEKEVGEFALHVQCAWNIIHNGRVIIGSYDIFYLPDLTSAEKPEDFRWDKGPNRRDVLLEKFFENETRKYAVRSIEAKSGGQLTIELNDDYSLNITPDQSAPETEYWRFFKPYLEGPHFVVKVEGLTG